MTDLQTVETDATKVLADTKATIATLESNETKGVTYIKAHIVWFIGIAAFLAGALLGHFAK